jgi:hypothetical protein
MLRGSFHNPLRVVHALNNKIRHSPQGEPNDLNLEGACWYSRKQIDCSTSLSFSLEEQEVQALHFIPKAIKRQEIVNIKR